MTNQTNRGILTMRLSWKVVAAVVIGGLWATPAFAFGHKNGCNGGTAGVTTVTVPATVTTTHTTTRPAFFSASQSFMNSTPSFITSSPSFITSSPSFITSNPSVAFVHPGIATFNGATVSNFGSSTDNSALVQSIQALNATLTTTNTHLARIAARTPGTRSPGTGIPPLTPPPPIGFGAGTASIADVDTGVPDHHFHEAAVNQYLRAGNRTAAMAQFTLSAGGLSDLKATVQDWEAANQRMAAKLGIKIVP